MLSPSMESLQRIRAWPNYYRHSRASGNPEPAPAKAGASDVRRLLGPRFRGDDEIRRRRPDRNLLSKARLIYWAVRSDHRPGQRSETIVTAGRKSREARSSIPTLIKWQGILHNRGHGEYVFDGRGTKTEDAGDVGRRALCQVQAAGAGAGLGGPRPVDCRGRPGRAPCALRQGASHRLYFDDAIDGQPGDRRGADRRRLS